MAFALKRIQSLFIADEDVSFSVENTSAAADGTNYYRVPIVGEAQVALSEEELRRDVALPYMSAYKGVVGSKGGTLTFRVHAEGLTTASATAPTAPATAVWLDNALLACPLIKSAATGAGTLTGSSSSTTSLVLTAGHGARFEMGQAVGMLFSSVMHVSYVTAISTDTLTISPAMPADPDTADSTTVYGSVTYYPSDNVAVPTGVGAHADPGTASFVAVNDAGIEYLLLGCRGNVRFIDGVQPMLEFVYQVNTFSDGDLSTRVKLAPTHANYPTLPTKSVITGFGNRKFSAGAAGTAEAVAELTADLGMTLTAKASTAGTSGRAGWVPTDGAARSVSFKPYYDTTWTWATDDYGAKKNAGTTLELAYRVGSTSTNVVAIHVPKAEIIDYPNEEDLNGNVGYTVNTQARDAGTGTDDSTATRIADIKLAFL